MERKISKITLNRLFYLLLAIIVLGSCVFTYYVNNGFTFQKSSNVYGNVNNRILQFRLSELGYYSGKIDGVFDREVSLALKEYQKEKNLNQTGVLDYVTADTIGVKDNTQANTNLYLLAKLIYSESRGEPYVGQVAVGGVVLNRVKSPQFPNTIEGVIYQPWAFTALHDGQFNLEPNTSSYQAAQDALNGWDPSYGSLFYYNPATASSSWIFDRQTVVTIGRHVFAI